MPAYHFAMVPRLSFARRLFWHIHTHLESANSTQGVTGCAQDASVGVGRTCAPAWIALGIGVGSAGWCAQIYCQPKARPRNAPTQTRGHTTCAFAHQAAPRPGPPPSPPFDHVSAGASTGKFSARSMKLPTSSWAATCASSWPIMICKLDPEECRSTRCMRTLLTQMRNLLKLCVNEAANPQKLGRPNEYAALSKLAGCNHTTKRSSIPQQCTATWSKPRQTHAKQAFPHQSLNGRSAANAIGCNRWPLEKAPRSHREARRN